MSSALWRVSMVSPIVVALMMTMDGGVESGRLTASNGPVTTLPLPPNMPPAPLPSDIPPVPFRPGAHGAGMLSRPDG